MKLRLFYLAIKMGDKRKKEGKKGGKGKQKSKGKGGEGKKKGKSR